MNIWASTATYFLICSVASFSAFEIYIRLLKKITNLHVILTISLSLLLYLIIVVIIILPFVYASDFIDVQKGILSAGEWYFFYLVTCYALSLSPSVYNFHKHRSEIHDLGRKAGKRKGVGPDNT